MMQALTIYYDGNCPLCRAEITFLQSRNRARLLRFVDLHDPLFGQAAEPFSCVQALQQIHARLDDGELLTGVRVFAEAYRRAELHTLARLLSINWLQPAWNAAYGWFARHRPLIARWIGPLLMPLHQGLGFNKTKKRF
jgi:predicted DCC family thiol-disulfide oxidoreductase YuxK